MFQRDSGVESGMYSGLRVVLYSFDIAFANSIFELLCDEDHDGFLFEPDRSNLEAFDATEVVVYDLGIVDNNLKLATIDILHMKNISYSKPIILVGDAAIVKRAMHLNRIGPLVAQSLEKPFCARRLLSMIDVTREEFMNVSLKKSLRKKVGNAFKVLTLGLISVGVLMTSSMLTSEAVAAESTALNDSVASLVLPESSDRGVAQRDAQALLAATPARMIERATPAYPRRAFNSNVDGWVEVAYRVNEEGQAVNIEVVRAYPENVFDASSVKAIKKCKFSPAKDNVSGQPVMSGVNVTKYNFSASL